MLKSEYSVLSRLNAVNRSSIGCQGLSYLINRYKSGETYNYGRVLHNIFTAVEQEILVAFISCRTIKERIKDYQNNIDEAETRTEKNYWTKELKKFIDVHKEVIAVCYNDEQVPF